MLEQQKQLFLLDEEVTYLNCAAYSPLLKTVVEAGNAALLIKTNPQNINPKDLFFDRVDTLRNLLTKIIGAKDPNEIAIIPAVSYGMAIVAKNLQRWPSIKTKKEVVLIADEFPNNVYTFERSCKELDLELKIVNFPEEMASYNQKVLDAISEETALIVMPHVHWINGYKFDLKSISEKCLHHEVMLVIDGTQSVGILPFDLQEIKVNALICGSYKWMMGPYSHGFAYFDSFFDDGIPLEETWMNRMDSDNFAGLLSHQKEYRPKAQRYNVGEFSHFIQTPMAIAAAEQILNFGILNLQSYCVNITQKPIQTFLEIGCSILDEAIKSSHLFAIKLPQNINISDTLNTLKDENISVSLRGDALRISPHIYNVEDDLMRLVSVLKNQIK
jgi:selenocysteine lyase/cysteine desulfurase